MIRSELTTRNAQKLVKANIGSILPCDEMQQAFYLLSQQSSKDPGVILARAELQGQLDRAIFEQCWNLELSRHEALRMSVRPRKDGTPMRVIWKELEQEIEFLDEALDDRSRSNLIERVKSEIDLERPPVSKVVAESIGQNCHRIYWAFHHLLMDGWSTAVVLRDVIHRYDARIRDKAAFRPANKPSYAEYFRITQEYDFWAAREHWTREMEGFSGCPVLSQVRSSDASGDDLCDTVILSREVSARLQSLSRELGLTMGVVAAGAWSLIVHRLLQSSDIAIGMTVSGRNLALEGIHNLVGLLARVIPFRSQLDTSQTAFEWLAAIGKSQFRSQQYEYLPLSEIEELCELQPRTSLFENLLVVENFLHPGSSSHEPESSLTEFSSGATSGYPVTCYVVPGDKWKIKVVVKASLGGQQFGVEKQFTAGMERVLNELANANQTTCVKPVLDSAGLTSLDGISTVESDSDEDAKVVYTETELRLASIWEKVLGLTQVHPTDNFFQIGGRSVTAVRICAAVENEMGVKLSPGTLVEQPTIAQLAKRISSHEEGFSPLIRFNDRQSDDLIVCAHVGSGYASYYRHLARHLGDFQVLGVQSTGMNDGRPTRSFGELAKILAEGIERTTDPQRIHLIGYCMSARFIVALARELHSRGHCIENLISIDSGPYWKTRPLKLNDFVAKSGSIVRGTVQYSRRSYQRFLKWLRYRAALVSHDMEFAAEFRSELVGRETIHSFARYDMGSIEFPFKLIRSRSFSDLREKDFHMQWRKYAENFEYCTVEASHEQILLEPVVRKIADVVRGIVETKDYSASSTIWRN